MERTGIILYVRYGALVFLVFAILMGANNRGAHPFIEHGALPESVIPLDDNGNKIVGTRESLCNSAVYVIPETGEWLSVYSEKPVFFPMRKGDAKSMIEWLLEIHADATSPFNYGVFGVDFVYWASISSTKSDPRETRRFPVFNFVVFGTPSDYELMGMILVHEEDGTDQFYVFNMDSAVKMGVVLTPLKDYPYKENVISVYPVL